MKDDSSRIKDVYNRVPLSEIPWNSSDPPKQLVKLVDSGMVKPCKTLDVGCGTGNYSIFLAKKGFSVTGIDRSSTALRIARDHARKQMVSCQFYMVDVIKDFNSFQGLYGFIFDWQLLHHIFPEFREQYVRNVFRLLKPGGKYLSMCFHEDDPQFGGMGKYRKTSLDSELYFSSEEELMKLFSLFFDINEFKVMEFGVSSLHVVNFVFMGKN